MEISQLEDYLSSEDKLQNLCIKVNRTRTKQGMSVLDVGVLKKEYELALEVEKAKLAKDLILVATKMQELINHQNQYNL